VLALPIRRHSRGDVARVWVGTKGTRGWGRTGSVGGCERVGVLTWHPNELWVGVRWSESSWGGWGLPIRV